MLTKSEAEELVKRELRQMETPELPFDIVESATLEKAYGWVFFYNSKRFIETQESIYQLAGNGPIFINKVTGAVTVCGTNKPLCILIEEYERSLC
jgi:hypothetical protein